MTRLPTVPADPDFDITKHAGGLPARGPDVSRLGHGAFGGELPLTVAEGTSYFGELARVYEAGQMGTRYHPWWGVHPAVAGLIRDMERDELERARAQLDAAIRRAPIAAFVVVWRAVVDECALRFDDSLRPIDWE